MIRIAICDDDIQCAGSLESMILEKENLPVEVRVDTYCDPYKCLAQINAGIYYDIIFLDIELGGISGIDIAAHIRDDLKNLRTVLIYVSGYDNYYKDLFVTNPSGFISKPLIRDEVKALLMISLERIKALSIDDGRSFFTYKVNQDQRMVALTNIYYFESCMRQMKIVMKHGTDVFYSSTKTVVSKIDSSLFIMPHRSFYVNLIYVEGCTREKIQMVNGDIIPISALRTVEVQNRISAYLEETL